MSIDRKSWDKDVSIEEELSPSTGSWGEHHPAGSSGCVTEVDVGEQDDVESGPLDNSDEYSGEEECDGVHSETHAQICRLPRLRRQRLRTTHTWTAANGSFPPEQRNAIREQLRQDGFPVVTLLPDGPGVLCIRETYVDLFVTTPSRHAEGQPLHLRVVLVVMLLLPGCLFAWCTWTLGFQR